MSSPNRALILRPHMLLVSTMQPFLQRVLGNCDVVREPEDLPKYAEQDYEVLVISTSFIRSEGVMEFMEAVHFASERWPNAKLLVTSTVSPDRLKSFVGNMFTNSGVHINLVKPDEPMDLDHFEQSRLGSHKRASAFLITKYNFENEESESLLENTLRDYLNSQASIVLNA